MKKIKYQLYCKNGYYILKDINSKKILQTTVTFYSMYCFIKQLKIYDFDLISLPRLTLYKFFRDFASFNEEERI